jgi:hypothetical protein
LHIYYSHYDNIVIKTLGELRAENRRTNLV